MGSGKGKIRQALVQKHPERDYIVIDPDLIKESMPDYQQAIAKKDINAANNVHEKSVQQATTLLGSTIAKNKNFIYESTGSRFWIYEEQMQAAKKQGMFVELIYVETTITNCFLRAFRRGLETGRFVPNKKIESSHRDAKDFFSELKIHAHQWKKYNNDSQKPRLLYSKYFKMRTLSV